MFKVMFAKDVASKQPTQVL